MSKRTRTRPLPASDPASPPTTDLFQAIGGSAKCRELSTAFYARVAKDPILRPLFPGETFKCAIEEFAAFLAQLLGGPSQDTQRRWWLSLHESHLRFQIGPVERDAWIGHMRKALSDVAMSDSMRSSFDELFDHASAYLVNHGATASATQARPEPSDVHAEIASRWQEQRALDEAVAAVREGDLHRTMEIIAAPPLHAYFLRSRSIFANFLGLLLGSANLAMAEYAERILHQNPDLAHERYSGRTLLHAASAAGNAPAVEALLKLGVDPNIQDEAGHTPLYSAANECRGGGAVVKRLIQAGAKVDACDGVKRCTPLHMAARRDNVDISEALLECGANIEARDSLGDTPLCRRSSEIVVFWTFAGGRQHHLRVAQSSVNHQIGHRGCKVDVTRRNK